MLKFSDEFEKIVSKILLGFAMAILSYQIIQLIWNTVESFALRFREAGLEYAPEYGKSITIMFFNLLLMLEIMQTIKVFASNHIVKVRIIMIVCLIAVSRKILALGEHSTDPMSELAIAALILSLAVGFHLVSKYADDSIGKEHETQK
jgi:uncharacterized membrane protein (DUF373 family)